MQLSWFWKKAWQTQTDSSGPALPAADDIRAAAGRCLEILLSVPGQRWPWRLPQQLFASDGVIYALASFAAASFTF